MTTPFDVEPNSLIGILSEKLKSDFDALEPPEWAPYVKTGMHKERVPDDEDWWYVRSAAVLRTVYIDGPIGIERLRTKYGGKRDRGNAPPRFAKGSGNILRKVCQQLEAAKLVEKVEREGRRISPKGKSLLDKCAEEVAGG